jgi:lipid-binding SYLF domain-containing protein
MNADVLTYSRSKGLSAGVSLEGASMESDNDGNKAVYGKDISAEDFVTGGLAVAPAATSLVNLLDMTSRARK